MTLLSLPPFSLKRPSLSLSVQAPTASLSLSVCASWLAGDGVRLKSHSTRRLRSPPADEFVGFDWYNLPALSFWASSFWSTVYWAWRIDTSRLSAPLVPHSCRCRHGEVTGVACLRGLLCIDTLNQVFENLGFRLVMRN